MKKKNEILPKLVKAGFSGACERTLAALGGPMSVINVDRKGICFCSLDYYAKHAKQYKNHVILFEENVDVEALAEEFIPKPPIKEYTVKELVEAVEKTCKCRVKLKSADVSIEDLLNIISKKSKNNR